MSVTHPVAGFVPVSGSGFASQHPHLAPFLLAVGIVASAIVVALSFTGLPT
jgi:hypothetical protein